MDVQLKNYFGELAILQDSLVQVKVFSDELAENNRRCTKEKTDIEAKLKNMQENLGRKDLRIMKLKASLDTYRNDISKLILNVEHELDRLKHMSDDERRASIQGIKGSLREVTENLYINKLNVSDTYIDEHDESPVRGTGGADHKHDTSNVWFDIEKSQQRYETLLDSYQNIIKDKDSYLRTLEEEMNGLKKERFNLEDEHFRSLREKDNALADLNNRLSDADRQRQRLQDEHDDRYGALEPQVAGLQGRLDEAHEFISNLKQEKADLLTRLALLDGHLLDAHDKTKWHQDQNQTLEEQLESLKAHVETLDNELAAKEDELVALRADAETGATQLTHHLQV